MPGSVAYLYGLAPGRDRTAVERYLARYVDPVYWRLGDRHRGTPTDEYAVSFVPAGTPDPEHYYEDDDYVEVRTWTELLDAVFARPEKGARALQFAATPDRPGLAFPELVLTPDGGMIYGVGVDTDYDDWADLEGEAWVAAVVQPLLRELCESFGCPRAVCVHFDGPPMTDAEFQRFYDEADPAMRYPLPLPPPHPPPVNRSDGRPRPRRRGRGDCGAPRSAAHPSPWLYGGPCGGTSWTVAGGGRRSGRGSTPAGVSTGCLTRPAPVAEAVEIFSPRTPIRAGGAVTR